MPVAGLMLRSGLSVGGRVKPGSLSGRGRSSGAIGIGSRNGVVGGLAGRLALTWVALVANGYNSTSQTARLFVLDLATGAVLPDVIESATGDFTFSPDSRWIFWTNRDDNGRPDKIFRRPARGGETTLVYQEDDDGLFMSVGRTADDAFVVAGGTAVSRMGDIWSLGRHRLLCGDTRSAIDMDRLMDGARADLVFTDPSVLQPPA